MTRRWIPVRSRPYRRPQRLLLEPLEIRLAPHAGHEGGFTPTVDADSEYCALLPAAPDPPPGDSPAGAAPRDLGDTFRLHSRSSATAVIYLDFNGHTTQGTWWNGPSNPTIITPAFDLDGNSGAFNNTELQRIQNIWQRVAEDFSPFQVDVTTEEPDGERLRNSGMRAIIGGDGAWAGYPGGIAFVDVFGNGMDLGCFIFPDNLGSGWEKYVADAISHELGHTLGLLHDGRDLPGGHQEYYDGHGSGATSWGPIMGSPFSYELTQWSKGEYPFASNTEDDLQIITSQNSFGFRADDHADTLAGATPATLTGTTLVSGQGQISRNTDVDYFTFDSGAGPITIDVTPDDRSPNLDIRAELYDGAGNLIASDNPSGGLAARLTATVAAGQYFLKIDGVGKGDPLDGGYSDYASLGQYSFNGTVVEPPPPGPIQVTGVSVMESTSGKITAFRVTFNVAPDPLTIQRRDVRVTGPVGNAVRIKAVRPVPGTVTVYDFRIRPQRLAGTGGVRLYLPPTVSGARGGLAMDQDGDTTPGETEDYFSTAAFRFYGGGGAVPDDGATADFPLSVPAGRALTIQDLNVRVNLLHPRVGDLRLELISPQGDVIPVFQNRGGEGDNLRNTGFDDQGTWALEDGRAPFARVFQPDGGSLADLLGDDAAGDWKLRVADGAPGEAGQVLSWGLALAAADVRSFPTVTSVVRVNESGSALAERVTGVIVTFDRPMNPGTITRADFRIVDPDGRRVRVRSVAPLDATHTQFRVITPVWRKAGTYTIAVGPRVADTLGNGLDGNSNGAFLDRDDGTLNSQAIDNHAFFATPRRLIPRGPSIMVGLRVRTPVSIDQLAVELNIQHPSVGDLKVTLIAPDGTEIVLSDHRGGAGSNFTNTVFSTAATTSIADGSAPFTGDFRADDAAGLDSRLGTIGSGKWRLRIEDTGIGEVGRLLSWGLYLKPAP
jgi:subtilisin-like proprotein convertase family protein